MKKIEAVEKDGNENNAAARERILKAAEELFIERGFDGVSVNDVAVRAGFAKGLVFYYFNSKKELFDTVLDSYYKAQAVALMDAFITGGAVRERLHSGLDAYMDFIERNPGYPRLIQREICSGSRNLDKVMQHMEPLHRWGTALLGGKPAGPMSARHFFVSFFGMVINYYTYSNVLGRLWGSDPMDTRALRERREHIHFVLDAVLNKDMLGD